MANINPFGAFAEGLESGIRTGTATNLARSRAALERAALERAQREEAYQKDLARSMAGLDTVRGSGVEGVTRGSEQDQMLATQSAGLESESEKRAEKGRKLLDRLDAAQAAAFRHGRVNDAADAFAKALAIREQFAKEAVAVADREFAVKQDPSAYFRVYEWVGDGITPVAGQWTSDPATGKRAYQVRYRAEDGTEQDQLIPEEQVPDYIAQVRNPDARAKLAMERAAKQWEYENLGGREKTLQGERSVAAQERNALANERRAEAAEVAARRPASGATSKEVLAMEWRLDALRSAGVDEKLAKRIVAGDPSARSALTKKQRADIVVALMKMKDTFDRPIYKSKAEAEAAADSILAGSEPAATPGEPPPPKAPANRPPLSSFQMN